MDTSESKKRTRVRAYPLDFKARLVDESNRPGASVAKVALANGINANMLHTWRREARSAPAQRAVARPEFVPLPLGASMPGAPASIHIELRRGATSVTMDWPVTASAECAAWLRELLR